MVGVKVRQSDELAMRHALEVAQQALATGDVPIGAVVIGPDGSELARACNRREADQDPTAHAEILALRQAARVLGSWRLDGATLAVTLEPCAMCAGALVLSRVARVVYAVDDPKAGAAGSLWDVLRDRRLNHQPEVVTGVCADEARQLLVAFFKDVR